MASTKTSLSGLKITIDASKLNATAENDVDINELSSIHCDCLTEFCECESKLGVTQANAKGIYSHLGYPNGREDMISEGYRLNTINIWGTQDLSTSEIMNWLVDFNPKSIEWIDDFSCNIVVSNENVALRMFTKLTEPFDRRVALAAMAAVASMISVEEPARTSLTTHTSMQSDDILNDQTSISNNESISLTEHMPSSGRWFKSLATPERAFCLYLRFSHKSDVKLPGAERRSKFYKRYGNPNYGGMAGILSGSFRRRTRDNRKKDGSNPNGDLRRIRSLDSSSFVNTASFSRTSVFTKTDNQVPTQSDNRKLITYDDLYDDNSIDDTDDLDDLARNLNESLISVHSGIHPINSSRSGPTFLPSGVRREAAACGLNSQQSFRRPPKWSRRDQFPFSRQNLNDSNILSSHHPITVDLREPWSSESSKVPNNFFGFKARQNDTTRGSIKHRLGTRNSQSVPLATITLFPDSEGRKELVSSKVNGHRLLTSLCMVADMEEAHMFSSHGSCNHKASNSKQPVGFDRRNQTAHSNRNVWTRLG